MTALSILKADPDSGFHVYIGDKISSNDQTSLGNLARYIIRACFSQERMVYIPAGIRGREFGGHDIKILTIKV